MDTRRGSRRARNREEGPFLHDADQLVVLQDAVAVHEVDLDAVVDPP